MSWSIPPWKKWFVPPDLGILVAYFSLTFCFTFPLGLRIGQALPGLAPDTFQYYWNLDWEQRAIVGLGSSPLYSYVIYSPYGVSLAYDTLALGNFLLALPLQLVFGLPAAYTLATLALFAGSGYAAYLLAYDLVRDRGAAFVTGFIFAFAPYHFAHLAYGHFNLIATLWLPLCALAARKYFNRPQPRSLVLLLVFLVWAALAEWYYALYTLLALALYAAFRLARERAWRAALGLIPLAALYLILLSPLWVPMLREANDWPGVFRGAEQADKFSADLLSYVTPSSFNPLLGSLSIDERFIGGVAERTLFVGFTTLTLSAIALLARNARRRDFWFWLVLGVLGFTLSLGPVLHIGGETRLLAGGQITLPYAWIQQLPLLSQLFAVARSVGRFGVITLLAAALLAAYGLSEVMLRVPQISPSVWVGLTCLVLGIEFVVVPIPTTLTDVPPAIQALANETGEFALLDAPFDFKTGGEAMYWQTVHHQPTLNGYVSRQLPFPAVQGTRSLRPMLLLPDPSDVIVAPIPPPLQVLRALNVRYVVLHKQWDPRATARAQRWIANNLGNPLPLADDERFGLYRVPDAPAPPLLASFAQGWYDPDRFGDGSLWRWMQNDARLLLIARDQQSVALQFDARSLAQKRHLEVWLDGDLIANDSIESSRTTHVVVPKFTLSAGTHAVRFHSVEDAGQPAAAATSSDTRLLSIAFSQIALAPEH
jgi:hypothetical protein